MRGEWCWGRIEKILELSCGKKLINIGGTLLDNDKFRIRDGNRVCFWKDLWYGKEAMCTSFPTLFSLVVNKEARMFGTTLGMEDGAIVLLSPLVIGN